MTIFCDVRYFWRDGDIFWRATGACDWHAVKAVKTAVNLPVIVNGDIVDAASAREALKQSGADAVMIGRGACGRPWIAACIDRTLRTGSAAREPSLAERLTIALAHLADSTAFYGESNGVKIFRKHLAWYIEQAPGPPDAGERRAAKARLCRLTEARGVEVALRELWSQNIDFI